MKMLKKCTSHTSKKRGGSIVPHKIRRMLAVHSKKYRRCLLTPRYAYEACVPYRSKLEGCVCSFIDAKMGLSYPFVLLIEMLKNSVFRALEMLKRLTIICV